MWGLLLVCAIILLPAIIGSLLPKELGQMNHVELVDALTARGIDLSGMRLPYCEWRRLAERTLRGAT